MRLSTATYSEDPLIVEDFDLDLLSNRDVYTMRDQSQITYGENNDANEYSTIDGQAATYDAAGNLYQLAGYRYYYDAENHLIMIKKLVSGGGGGPLGPMGPTGGLQVWKTIAQFYYDPLGRRIRAIHYNILTSQPVSDTLFYYDGDRVLAEYDCMTGTPVLLRYYIDGLVYVDEHILVNDVAAGEHYYLLKELYAVAGLADANGSMAEAYNYDAYGR